MLSCYISFFCLSCADEHVIHSTLKLKLCRAMGTNPKKQSADSPSSSARQNRTIDDLLADKDTDADVATYLTALVDGGYCEGSAIAEGSASPGASAIAEGSAFPGGSVIAGGSALLGGLAIAGGSPLPGGSAGHEEELVFRGTMQILHSSISSV